MNAAQLRKLGFIEAADELDRRGVEVDRARVYVEHTQKSPADATLCADTVAVLDQHGGRFPYTPQRLEDVQPIVKSHMAKYNDWRGTLTDDEIALMEAMTRETAHDDAKDDAMGRLW